MRKLRCWIGNLDGRDRGLVIAKTKKRAMEVIGRISRERFNGYWSELSDVPLGFQPETLYTIPFNDAMRVGRSQDNPSLWTARPGRKDVK